MSLFYKTKNKAKVLKETSILLIFKAQIATTFIDIGE